jgi:hypothetical protein
MIGSDGDFHGRGRAFFKTATVSIRTKHFDGINGILWERFFDMINKIYRIGRQGNFDGINGINGINGIF